MLKKILAGFIIATFAVVALEAQRGGAASQFPSPERFAASTKAQQHVANAMKIAGNDLQAEAKAFCSATGPRRVALTRQAQGLPPLPDRPLEPIKMFDNLYYLGFSDVGAWAITTSDGIIVFDALNSPDEGRDMIAGGLKKVGLDPAQIKYLIIGHGHNDHTGGGSYLQTTYKPRVIMGGPDWDLHLKGARADRPAMTRDIVATDGQKVTVGDTTVTIVLTPGHTPGTIGMIAPVKHQGRTHNVLLLSGTQMPTQQSLGVFEHVFNDFAKKQHAEAALGSHPDILMNKLTMMEQLGTQYPSGAHPLLIGPQKFARYLDIMIECGRARLAALES